MKSNAAAALALAGSAMLPDFLSGSAPGDKRSYTAYLRKSAVPRKELDIFLNEHSWAQFDPEVGYILGNYMPHDGMDSSYTLSTVMKDRKRTSQVYAGMPCRINTYGNSFTQCHQVSDAETWQEYLAGHLGEPIRNYGMGGFGVYQAYCRMLREEQSGNQAEYVILYMWGDDYVRSLFRCRYATYYRRWDNQGGTMFHGNFWSNIEMDPAAGILVEEENRVRTREDLYLMSDPEFMVENLKDDLMVQLHLLSRDMVNTDLDVKGLNRLASILTVPEVDFADVDRMKSTANILKNRYSFEATKYILNRTSVFCKKRGKNLLVIHFDPYGVFVPLVNGEERYDQDVINYIRELNLNYFDMNEVHREDYKNFSIPLEEYMKRYFIGHYKPAGNHFFAYSLKDTIVNWLDPKPITYRGERQNMEDFNGYLEK